MIGKLRAAFKSPPTTPERFRDDMQLHAYLAIGSTFLGVIPFAFLIKDPGPLSTILSVLFLVAIVGNAGAAIDCRRRLKRMGGQR